MTEATQRRLAEAVPVTLMRIEGMVGGVAKDIANLADIVTDLKTEVVVHRGQLGTIESKVQQLQSDATVAAKAVIDAEIARQTTAELLKEATAATLADAKAADDKKVFDAKALVEQSSTTWSQRQTLAVIGGFILAVIVGVFGIIWAIKTGTPPPKLP